MKLLVAKTHRKYKVLKGTATASSAGCLLMSSPLHHFRLRSLVTVHSKRTIHLGTYLKYSPISGLDKKIQKLRSRIGLRFSWQTKHSGTLRSISTRRTKLTGRSFLSKRKR